jgi:peptidyl-prolyl cis-trans isomerase D
MRVNGNFGKIAVKLLLAVLILSFTLWGVGEGFRTNMEGKAVKIGDTEITETEFKRLYDAQVRMLEQSGNSELLAMVNSNPLLQEQIKRLVLEGIFIRNLANETGFIISDDMAKFEIAAMPHFQKDGKFDGETFDRILKMSNMQPNAFVEAVKDELSLEQLTLLLNLMKPDLSLMSQHLAKAHNQTRLVDVANIKIRDIVVSHTPTDEELQEVINSNAQQFITPELRAFSFLVLNYKKLCSAVRVQEAQMRKYYEQNKHHFASAPKRTVSQMVFKNEELAKQALQELELGKEFSAVAKAFFPEQKKFSLGEITAEGLNPEIAEVIFTLGVGHHSNIINSPLGYHIFLVEKIIESKIPEFKAVEKAVGAQLLAEEQQSHFSKIIQAIEHDMSYGISLEEIAAKHGVKLHKVKFNETHPMLKSKTLKELIRNTEPGMNSAATPLEEGKDYAIVRIDDVLPSGLPPLQEIKGNALKFWKGLQQKKLAAEKAHLITDEVAKGKNFEVLCKNNGVPIERRVEISKKRKFPWDNRMPFALHNEAFGLKAQNITSHGLSPDKESYIIVKVLEIHDHRVESDEYEKVAFELEQSMIPDMLMSAMALYRDTNKMLVNVR